jgi:hypothetical protein
MHYLCRHDGTNVLDVVSHDHADAHHAYFYGATWDAKKLRGSLENRVGAKTMNQVESNAEACPAMSGFCRVAIKNALNLTKRKSRGHCWSAGAQPRLPTGFGIGSE